jgi:hypothetical protein
VNASPQIPIGTQVVLRTALPDSAGALAQRGATGRIVAIDNAAYEVQLGDGRTVAAARRQLALRKHHQAHLAQPQHTDDGDGHRLVGKHTIYAAVVGSRAFGQGEPKWKHVMHLLRLQIAAVDLLTTGNLTVHVGAHRDRLLDVRAGQIPWPDVEAWRLDLHRQLDHALTTTVLPAAPDVDRVNTWLYTIRAASAQQELT